MLRPFTTHVNREIRRSLVKVPPQKNHKQNIEWMKLLSFKKLSLLKLISPPSASISFKKKFWCTRIRTAFCTQVKKTIYLALKLNKVNVYTRGSYINNKTSKELQLKQQSSFSRSNTVATILSNFLKKSRFVVCIW